MALDTNPHDINRGTTGIALPDEISNEIWAKAQEASVIMALSRRVDLPGTGETIQVVTGDPTVSVVAESTEIGVSNSTFGTKAMTPYKFATIELVSKELINDLPRLYDTLIERIPGAIGVGFDGKVFGSASVGTGFDVLGGTTAVAIDASGKSAYEQLLTAMDTVADYGGNLDAWVLCTKGEVALLGETDQVGRPLFTPGVAERSIGRILGAETYNSKAVYVAGDTSTPTPDVLGFAGDFSQTRWGMVDGITLEISRESTINDGTKQINLWQRDMVGIKVEARLGFVSRDDGGSPAHFPFVRLTKAHPSA